MGRGFRGRGLITAASNATRSTTTGNARMCSARRIVMLWIAYARAAPPTLRGCIKQALDLFRTRYPRVKAAVYWHERWQNADGSYSNLRVNSSVESLNAYRAGAANPDWLGNLILRAIPKK